MITSKEYFNILYSIEKLTIVAPLLEYSYFFTYEGQVSRTTGETTLEVLQNLLHEL